MKNSFSLILLLVLLGLFCVANAQEGPWQSGVDNEEEDYGYESWPGKDGTIRRSIELSVTSLSGYGLQLAPGFTDSSVFLKLPISEDDTVNIGRLDIKVYQTIEKAQRALVEYLYTIVSFVKPPRLTAEEFPIGDVAFGEEREGVFFGVFTRANIRIVIEAPTSVAKELASKIDDTVMQAPSWGVGDSCPAFIISEEFVRAFRPTLLGINEGNPTEAPQAFTLKQNRPNPFNTSTLIMYEVPLAGNVFLKVYNSLGQEVATLMEGHQEAGHNHVFWNGKDNKGNLVSSGTYLYKLQAGVKEEKRSMTLVR